MKASQVGGSEIGVNWLGRTIAVDPCPFMVVNPSLSMSKRYVLSRFDPLTANTPSVREKMASVATRAKTNSLTFKAFVGGYVAFASANSPSQLRMTPAKRLLLEEVDGYGIGNKKDKEGDPEKLAETRTDAFAQTRQIFRVSTPTIEGNSRIARAFERTDKRYYHVPCKHCGHTQPLVFGQFRWDNHDPATTRYVCAKCEGTWNEADKNWYLPRGKWIASAIGKTPGFFLWAAYAPFGRLSHADIVKEFLDAGKDPELLQVFTNTKLGQTWSLGLQTRNHIAGVMARLVKFDLAEIEQRAWYITAGCDVQERYIAFEVVSWDIQESSWSIEYGTVHGDTTTQAPFVILADMLQNYRIGSAGIDAVCIDTGFNTSVVYDFITAMRNSPVHFWGIKGKSSPGNRIAPWPTKPTRRYSRAYLIGVDAIKEVTYARLKLAVAGAGFCYFPNDRQAQYFEGLLAETPVKMYSRGFAYYVWHKDQHTPNEPWDCRIYATAALAGLKAKNIRATRRALADSAQATRAAQQGTGQGAPAQVGLGRTARARARARAVPDGVH